MGNRTPGRGPSNIPKFMPPISLIGQAPQQPSPPPAIEMLKLPKPTFDFVLIERIFVGIDKDSKIVIPQNLIEKQTTAVVISVGQGRYDNGVWIVPECKPGDRVFVAPGSGVPIAHDGRSFFLVQNSSIWAIYPKDEESLEDKLKETPPASI